MKAIIEGIEVSGSPEEIKNLIDLYRSKISASIKDIVYDRVKRVYLVSKKD